MRTFTENLIAGRRQKASGREFVCASPHDERVDRSVILSNATDVDEAVAAAWSALAGWGATGLDERVACLTALADALEKRAEELTASIVAEVGTPARIATAVQVGLAITDARTFAKSVHRACESESIGHSIVRAKPLGVVAALTPWNYPLHQAIAKIGAATAAGCTVVLKPSELVPATTDLLIDAIAEAFPPGVVNVIHGDGAVGASLVAHADVDAISFTGSTATGRAIARVSGEALVPCFLELGGKSPAVILPGADLAVAVRSALNAGWLNSGQTCTALTRILVPEQALAEVAEVAAAAAEKMQPRLGPLISRAQFDRVQGFIERAIADGVQLVVGGVGRPAGADAGFFTKATVFIVRDQDHELVQDEIFGPVICVQPYSDLDEAIALANNTQFGLAAAVWGGDDDPVDQTVARLRAGQIDVNGAAFNPEAPFGGFGASGAGRELGVHGIREFTRPISVQYPVA